MKKQSAILQLQTLLQDFHGITNISIAYLPKRACEDGIGAMRFSDSAEPMNLLLAQLYRHQEIRLFMEKQEAEAIEKAMKQRIAIHRFEPFPGLVGYIFPVYVHGSLLGCFVFGPVLQSVNQYKQFQRAAHYFGCLQEDRELSGIYKQLPVCDEESVQAACRLLSQIVAYTNSIDSIAIQSRPLAVQLSEYIDTQYMNPISTSTACEHFHISRSTLSRVLSREQGDTFLSMLNRRRIDNVCKCLEDGMSIEEASASSGFSSPQYMARVFRTIMGCTPHAYRRSMIK